jgi:DNA-binding winged helix-turn-helix (wHTH) protein/tetratricopeptide (TPR) repeat protein
MDRSVHASGCYVFGPFRLDPARRELTRDGATISLTPTVFDVLLHLVENHGRVVSKEELLDAVWPRRVVEESNVSQSIFTLRKALNGAAESGRFIVTAPGRGYRFSAPVRLEMGAPISSQPDAPGVVGSLAAIGDEPTSRPFGVGLTRRRPILLWATLGAAAAACVGLALVLVPWRASHAPGSKSLVVLTDFQNRTGDPIFDQTLAKAAEIDLDQSPFVSVLPQRQVQDTLVLMTREKNEALTPSLADEVCARNDGQAVVDGAIAALGARYLLTLTATNCAGDRILAAEKAQVENREAVIPALDRLLGQMRRKLGESSSSVARFNIPLARQRTASLAALEAYSRGAFVYAHGDRAGSIPLFRHAIDLDPNFAAAYADLSTAYAGLHQTALATEAITKAYSLRGEVNEWERFRILAHYDMSVTRDVDQQIRDLRLWTETYPREGAPWADLSGALNWIGRYPEAIDAGRRALALSPGAEQAYAVLARAYLHDGRLGDAAATCAQAVARGVAGDETHGLILETAIGADDGATIAREIAWGRGKSVERGMLIVIGRNAYRLGKVRLGEAVFARVAQLSAEQGLADFTLAPRARELVDLGLTDQARALLARIPTDYDSTDYRFVMAEIGDAGRAQALLRRDLAASPADSLLKDNFAPEVQAAVALRRGHPRQAADALLPARRFEFRTLDVPYLRGRAYLAAGDGDDAATAFREVLDHPGVEPASPLLSLARLGLARAYRLEGQGQASRAQYLALLAVWKNADPDLPVLQQAKAEYARL